MKEPLIRAFGIFLNDFPYFALAVISLRDALQVSWRRALFRMLATTLVHALSILSWMTFYPGYRAIQMPHELFFLALYIFLFFRTVRVSLYKLLFISMFIKFFADVVSSLAAFAKVNLWEQPDPLSFGLEFNLAHLCLLAVLFPPMCLFISRQLRPLLRVESKLWRYLWMLPLSLLAISLAFTRLSEEMIDTSQYVVLCSLLLIFSMLVYALIAETFKAAGEKAQLEAGMLYMEQSLSMQSRQYQQLADSIEATRRARHDLRHQLAVLNGYLKAGDVESAKGYCHEIAENIPSSYDEPLCGNFAVNAVAQYYASLARDKGIELSLRLDVPMETGKLRERELCVVFGNLLENAVEACARQGEGNRTIRLRAVTRQGHLTIIMDNSFDGKAKRLGDGFLSSKREGLGVGLVSIRQVAEKNGGKAYFEPKDGIFHSSVILPLGEEA